MAAERARWQRAFDRANTRLSELPVERCRELEIMAARSLKFIGPRPPMLKELLRSMEEEPASEEFRERLHHTLRRLFARMMQAGARYESFETATTGLLDGQKELLEAHLTAALYLRPWGER